MGWVDWSFWTDQKGHRQGTSRLQHASLQPPRFVHGKKQEGLLRQGGWVGGLFRNAMENSEKEVTSRPRALGP